MVIFIIISIETWVIKRIASWGSAFRISVTGSLESPMCTFCHRPPTAVASVPIIRYLLTPATLSIGLRTDNSAITHQSKTIETNFAPRIDPCREGFNIGLALALVYRYRLYHNTPVWHVSVHLQHGKYRLWANCVMRWCVVSNLGPLSLQDTFGDPQQWPAC